MSNSKQVWKFALDSSGVLEMPTGAQVLSVDNQHGVAVAWALVDPEQPVIEHRLQVVGTGHEFEPLGKFIGTFQLEGGSLVFHVFAGAK